MPKIQISLKDWSDYRGKQTGLVMFMEPCLQAVLPIRDQLDDNGKGVCREPDYETGTYGLMSCHNQAKINGLVKEKHSYLFFAVRYSGLDDGYKGKYLICGMAKIDKVRDMRDRHMTDWLRNPVGEKPECFKLDKSWAIYSESMKFFDLPDCFEITAETMERWGMKKAPSRQMKLVLEGDALKEVLDFFANRKDSTEDYIETVKEFLDDEEEAEGEEA